MAGNTYGPNGPFGIPQPATQTPAADGRVYAPQWKPGGMYNMGSTAEQLAGMPPAPATKGPAETITAQPLQVQPSTPPAPTNTYGPNGAFGGSPTTSPTLDYLKPQEMVTDAITKSRFAGYRPLNGMFGIGYRR